jgi:hypothetical protein
VAVLLFFTTSSIYLAHDDDSSEAVSIAVETSNGFSFPPLPVLSTSPAQNRRLAGGPLFLFPPPGALLLRVEQPVGSMLPGGNVIAPRPWRRVNLLVSRDLQKLDLRLLRLTPNSTLMSLLPEPFHTTPGRTYRLRLMVDGQVFEVDDFRQGAVVVGGPMELLKESVEKESSSDHNAALEKCLMFAGVSRDEMMRKWNSNELLLETPIIGAGETVTVEVQDVNSSKTWSKTVIPAESLSTAIINTECLEVQIP